MEPAFPQPAQIPPLSALYARLLDTQVERLLAAQQPDGAFQAAGRAYSIYDQNGMYPLALAYLRPTGPYAGDPRLLEAVVRSGDRHVRQLNAQGQWEVITPGGRWGWSFDEWRLHFWLETLLLLGERLGSERLAEWDAAIEHTAAALAANLRHHLEQGTIDFVEGIGFSSPNHMAWHALVCRRAGGRYGHSDWVELADHLFAQMRAAQTADGFWLEFAAPSVGYNYVSLLAVGVYLEHLWPDIPPEWLTCIERGMEAQIRWSYPDGGIVSEIEGRQRYHGPSHHVLPALCARWPQGAEALRAAALRLLSRAQTGHFSDDVASIFLCETVRYLERHEQPAEIPPDAVSFWKARSFEAGWRRLGPWQGVLSGLVTPRYDSRWRLDIANLVGLYHIGGGLLAGGGHSKQDPEWATFTVWPAANADPVWLPSGAQLAAGDAADTLRLDYGGVPVRVDMALSPGEAAIRFALEAPKPGVSAVARLLRPLAPGAEVRGPDDEAYPLGIENPLAWTLDSGGQIRIGLARYLLPPGSVFRWPRLPFNPYSRSDASAASEAFAALEVPLNCDHPEGTIRVSVGER